ncbi:hypothetical protein [Streptomyces sp. NPDC001076]
MMTSTWPPRLRDTRAVANAYNEVLNWPIFLGPERLAPEQVERAFADSTDLVVSTPCLSFDAISLPYPAGIDALVGVDRQAKSVPSLRVGRRAVTLLVAPGTGDAVADLGGVSVRAGGGERIELLPAPGIRWDTPPWHIGEAKALGLLDALELRKVLTRSLALYLAPGGEQ